MTEQEAITVFEEILAIDYRDTIPKYYEAMELAVKDMKEVKKYRAIGTPDECRAAMEIAKNQGNTRTNNDVIAEYVKERYPGLIKNTDYKLYSFSMQLKSLRDNFKKEIKKIDFSQLPKAFDHLEEKK